MNARSLLQRLHAQALAYPEAYEERPWGHPAIKVRNKTFVWCSDPGEVQDTYTISVKLPLSGPGARELPWVEPTHYGMGKHGWVTARFEEGERVPVDELATWIAESYAAIAAGPSKKRRKPFGPSISTKPHQLVQGWARRMRIRWTAPEVNIGMTMPRGIQRVEVGSDEANHKVVVVLVQSVAGQTNVSAVASAPVGLANAAVLHQDGALLLR